MDTKIAVVEKGAIARVGALFVEAFGHSPALLVSDGNTLGIGGFALIQSLEQHGIKVRQCCFAALPQVYADEYSIERVRLSLAQDASIAVALGSGTLNDITKRASSEVDRPYMVVATAPSVDGYTSYGAAVSIKGFKQTLPCNAPTAVVADTDILCSAPMPMIGAGFGDCMAKFTAGADWIVADQLGLQPIRQDIWTMVQVPLRKVYTAHKEIADRDQRSIGLLFDALSASGFAMQVMHDSRPASGAEHLISHIWEMEHLEMDGLPVSHGFKVAVGTLAMSYLYEMLPRMDFSTIMQKPVENWEERKQSIERTFSFSPLLLKQILPIAQRKFLSDDALVTRRRAILIALPNILRRCSVHLPPFRELRQAMTEVSCPLRYTDINTTKENFLHAIRAAQMIRDRYTLLDLLYEAGFLEEALEAFDKDVF
ncbi:MAG TPA: sn-glycerol-1-phosphate dehydrogenase [Sphaerochaeta sp.]|nr:sn-glycerol-1-phosphate dehydrogenase [Sphaerochaeta sp.]